MVGNLQMQKLSVGISFTDGFYARGTLFYTAGQGPDLKVFMKRVSISNIRASLTANHTISACGIAATANR